MTNGNSVTVTCGWQSLMSLVVDSLINGDGSFAAVCNGEIYDYLELFSELEHLGHRLRKDSLPEKREDILVFCPLVCMSFSVRPRFRP